MSGFGCMFFDNADRTLPAQVGDVIRDGLLEARWSSNDKAVQMEVRPFLSNKCRIRCISVSFCLADRFDLNLKASD